MSTFFTSDHHFGHASIIRFCKRPFTDAVRMDEEMIARWNRVVRRDDVVYHLGDFAFKIAPSEIAETARKLNGQIHLIPGNHDRETLRARMNGLLPYWTVLPLYHEAEVEGQRIVMCHYGLRTWHHDLRGVWHIYGHSHGGLAPLGKSCDVGVDSWGFEPVEFGQLKAFMDKRPLHDAPRFEGYEPEVAGAS